RGHLLLLRRERMPTASVGQGAAPAGGSGAGPGGGRRDGVRTPRAHAEPAPSPRAAPERARTAQRHPDPHEVPDRVREGARDALHVAPGPDAFVGAVVATLRTPVGIHAGASPALEDVVRAAAAVGISFTGRSVRPRVLAATRHRPRRATQCG